MIFAHVQQHLMLGSCLIAKLWKEGFTKTILTRSLIREQRVALFPEKEGLGREPTKWFDPSFATLRRTICPSVSARVLARDSPDSAFSRHFRGFSACGSYSNHSQDHGQWQVCMCVWLCVLCMLCVVLCFFCSKI